MTQGAKKFLVVLAVVMLVGASIAAFGFGLYSGRVDLFESFLKPGFVEVTDTPNVKQDNGGAAVKEGDKTTDVVDKPVDARPSQKSSLLPKVVSAPAVQEILKAAQQITNTADSTLTRQGVIELTNKQRLKYLGVGANLAENSLLDRAAEKKIDDMMAGQYFEHVSPQGNGPEYFIEGAGYDYILIGENLATGGYDDDADLVKAWMDSPGHRENILKPGFKEIGVAVRRTMFQGHMTWLAVQEFGTPRVACPEVDDSLSVQVDAAKDSLAERTAAQEQFSQEIDRAKSRAQQLESQIRSMISAGYRGNDLEEMKKELNDLVADINSDVNLYNSTNGRIKADYNAYRAMLDEYNGQVEAFNNCLDSFK